VEGSQYFESPLLYKENGFREEKDALALIENLQDRPAVVQSIEKGTSRKRAPLLFNLAELQAECAKRFKISPDETLQVAQDLYEKKLTTYPRTDARVLSSAVAKEISKNISRLRGYEPTASFVERIMQQKSYANIAKTQYTDDSKVTDHYAIIPTGQLTELGSLNSLQKAVFELIVRRFLSIFYPPAEYQTVKLVVAVETDGRKEQFFTSAKTLKNPGYLEIAGIPKKKDKNDPNNERRGLDRVTGGAYSRSEDEENEEETADPQELLELADTIQNGDPISVDSYGMKEGKTSPPKRYTSGSMVLAMENAGQLIEDEELREQIKGSGIGTSATRAEIIKKLVRIHYLNLNKKTQVLTPENLGEMVYEVVHMTVPALLNPKMTASWEKGLDGITQGTVDFWDYRHKLEDFIRTETQKMMEQNLRQPLAERISDFAGKNAKGAGARRKIGVKCPACGGELITTPFGFGCANYKQDKSGCNFNIGEIAGVSLSEEQVKTLVEQGHTATIRGFKSKAGKKFDACLKLQKEESGRTSVAFDFDDVEPELVPEVKCPTCGGAIRKTSFGYGCVNFVPGDEQSCKFSIGTIAGKTLPVTAVRQLLTEGKTDTLRGFKSKAGKKFDACLVLEKAESGNATIQFDFDHVQQKLVKDVKCPLCGGEIAVTSFGYGCTNYKPGAEDSCHFSIGKMAEKSFTETQVRQLLTDGITETMRGFKSKTGKRFDARVALSKDEEGNVTGLKFDFDNVEPKKVKDVQCPKCGGGIVVAPFGFVCENHRRDDPESCRFMVGKVASVKIKESQLKELLIRKKTDVISGFVAKTGMKFDAPLKLTEEGDITFDFPEKPKPVETKVNCPRCGKPLLKSQWRYECECGFQVWHTVAKVELSEEIMGELLTTGKTKNKVSGFTSKAGNVFDACLKYENEQISFDFDNPGESAPQAKQDEQPFYEELEERPVVLEE
jgi:DNA topoisomerase-3